jgi:hypothetical protein
MVVEVKVDTKHSTVFDSESDVLVVAAAPSPADTGTSCTRGLAKNDVPPMVRASSEDTVVLLTVVMVGDSDVLYTYVQAAMETLAFHDSTGASHVALMFRVHTSMLGSACGTASAHAPNRTPTSLAR